uniref:Uncharacterized protein n=1 Tax=Neobodo designis TaxID=312471 RepID=A0A7S1W442_NEODS
MTARNNGSVPPGADPMVFRKLEAFYQSTVSPPPMGIYRDPEGFARYQAGVRARVMRIMEAYDGELRALHLDLIERHGASPFASDDQSPPWEGKAAVNRERTHRESASPTRARRSWPSASHSKSDSSSGSSAGSPGARRCGSVNTCVTLHAYAEPTHGIVFVPSSGSPRHPQQNKAASAIWASMQPPKVVDAAPERPTAHQPFSGITDVQ